jgi:hypothetical protein
MKKPMILLISYVLLISCQSNNSTLQTVEFIGDWKLAEVLSDPGNGTGSFVSVDSEKTMTFLRDGTLTSSGSLCSLDYTSTVPTSGVYSLLDSTYTTNDCGVSDIQYKFEIQDNALIVSYPCIEDCQSKFIKL